MSRPLRIEYPDAWYHVMNRGRRGESVFRKKEDYLAFIELLKETGLLKYVAPELENFIPGHEISFTQNCDEGYGLSRVMISVFFNPEWSSYAVGSNADLQGPSRPRESDLQVINVSRNSWGNLRVTVYNHGPDGLGNAPIQLAYGIANYEPGMPPPPPTAYWERYFLNVSPYGETSFDTGLPLPEDHELYLRIILSMVVGNITDPEADNNSSCWHIVPDGARPADDSHCPGG